MSVEFCRAPRLVVGGTLVVYYIHQHARAPPLGPDVRVPGHTYWLRLLVLVAYIYNLIYHTIVAYVHIH